VSPSAPLPAAAAHTTARARASSESGRRATQAAKMCATLQLRMVSMVRCVAVASRSDTSGPLASLPSMLIRLHQSGRLNHGSMDLAPDVLLQACSDVRAAWICTSPLRRQAATVSLFELAC
jgi:hypothetical protein